MSARIECAGLQVDPEIHALLENEILPGTGVEADGFWKAMADIVKTFTPRNRELLAVRDEMQAKISVWHKANPGADYDRAAYKAMLEDIGYLLPQPAPFKIATQNVDPEIAEIAGPQLVVPVMNARYALNAANARWGSLYDVLYGTDVISEEDGAVRAGAYNPVRGHKVIEWARDFLDTHFPLNQGSHKHAAHFTIVDGNLLINQIDGSLSMLAAPDQFVGFSGDADDPSGVLLKHNGLHAEIQIDREHSVGSTDAAGVKDICLESALTTIQDCEDSVAAVDAEDKTVVYRNWLGLMRGDLSESFNKGGQTLTRNLNADREFTSPSGESFSLPGRSLMFVRSVGHLMTNPAILDAEGNEIFEGIMDTLFTTACSLHDLRGASKGGNSRAGSMYIVKPKMHGPDEVSMTVDLFAAVEDAFGLPGNTLKVGIMDEERRTTVNLAECIRRASERVVFINTGFLDRTGDEIHTSMEAGPMVAKTAMKGELWINAYEDWNVDTGLNCGLRGKAQIGKGMWAMPDLMQAMIDTKLGHPKAGANCAWVPSPTAATLHVTHYHDVSVSEIQAGLEGTQRRNVADILTIPLGDCSQLSAEEIQRELDNNVQGMLGYVVRWVDHGVGCSKVPDINNVGLMEDRATLRISSQHIANWLHHGVITEDQFKESMFRMAGVVDGQNAADPSYEPMVVDGAPKGNAFDAASALVKDGVREPSGYTEPRLHNSRLRKKLG
ncbi:MAG: malate synthase G [Gammaproteobacteria bacterium]|nr:malate synthase G [Gammaproteobacteria bacterium]